jgi:hypothetical protein
MNRLEYNNNFPFLAHGNGNTNMNDLLLALGYKISNSDIELLNKYHYKEYHKKSIYYACTFIPIIIVLLVIILIIILSPIFP